MCFCCCSPDQRNVLTLSKMGPIMPKFIFVTSCIPLCTQIPFLPLPSHISTCQNLVAACEACPGLIISIQNPKLAKSQIIGRHLLSCQLAAGGAAAFNAVSKSADWANVTRHVLSQFPPVCTVLVLRNLQGTMPLDNTCTQITLQSTAKVYSQHPVITGAWSPSPASSPSLPEDLVTWFF